MSFYFFFIFHLVLCVSLIGLVLLQQGRGADLGAAFSGASNTLFGASGADKLVVRLTTVLAVLFMASNIVLVNAFVSKPASILPVTATAPGVVGELEKEQAEAAAASAAVTVVTPASAAPVSPEKVVPAK